MKKISSIVLVSLLLSAISIMTQEPEVTHIKNVENDTLFADSLISDNSDYRDIDPLFPDTILPGDSIFVTERFKPSTTNTISGTLEVHSSDTNSSVIDVDLLSTELESIPTKPFNLITPLDSAYVETSRPTFIWEAFFSSVSKLKEYEVYINDTLRHVGTDTTWTADYDLDEGFNGWFIIAYDSVGNKRQSNEVQVVVIDTTHPPSVTLISPVDGVYLADTSVKFKWSEITQVKNFSEENIVLSGDSSIVFSAPVRYLFELDTLINFVSPVVDTFDTASAILNLAEDFYYWRVRTFDLAGNIGSYLNLGSFIVDVTPPFIESTTVWNDTSYTGPFPVYTKVTDGSAVDIVEIYFKRLEDPTWFSTDMIIGVDNWYYNEIPQVFSQNDTIKYYICARDIAENSNESIEPPGVPSNYFWFIANSTPGIFEQDTIPESFSFSFRISQTREKVVFHLALPNDAIITLRIHDITGRLIDKPVEGMKSAGFYAIPWFPQIGAGIYFYTLESRWQKRIGKLVLIGGS